MAYRGVFLQVHSSQIHSQRSSVQTKGRIAATVIANKHIRQEPQRRNFEEEIKVSLRALRSKSTFFFIFLKLLTSAFDKISHDPFRACGEAVEFRNSLHGQCTCVRAIVHIVLPTFIDTLLSRSQQNKGYTSTPNL